MKKDNASDYKIGISVLRVLSVFLVVSFHIYGMCYADHISEKAKAMYRATYEHINDCYGINIAMPLFTFIAGYLFMGQLANARYTSLLDLMKIKFIRLGLPYFVFMTLMMATYSGFSIEPFYSGGYWHLWYLPMLWWMFVISYLLRNLIMQKNNILLFTILLFSFIIALYPIRIKLACWGLTSMLHWYYWFILGLTIAKSEEQLSAFIKKHPFIWVLAIVGIVVFAVFPTSYSQWTTLSMIGITSTIIVLWYAFSYFIPWKKMKITAPLTKISSYSFGIYILHYWIAVYLVSTTAKRLFPFIVPFAEQHIVLFPILFTLTAFSISTILTKLLLKTKIGRFLLG